MLINDIENSNINEEWLTNFNNEKGKMIYVRLQRSEIISPISQALNY